jgi:hypothetical protein
MSGDSHEEYNVLIHNAVGQAITELKFSGPSGIRHNTSAWAPGIYFYTVIPNVGNPLRGEFIIM